VLFGGGFGALTGFGGFLSGLSAGQSGGEAERDQGQK
jgi:hypothetical protein